MLDMFLDDPPDAPAQRNTVVLASGYIVDMDSGEIIGHIEAVEGFVIDSKEKVDWFMRKILRHETNIDARENELEAIRVSIQAEINEEKRAITWLGYRFKADLEAFYNKEIEGQKTKTIKTNAGKLYKRQVGGGWEVKDQQALIDWVRNLKIKKEHKDEVVKTRFEVSKTGLSSLFGHVGIPENLAVMTECVDDFRFDTGFVSTAERKKKEEAALRKKEAADGKLD